MSAGVLNKLGCLSTTLAAGLRGAFRSKEVESRGGVPGRVKWMVLGRKLAAQDCQFLARVCASVLRGRGLIWCTEGGDKTYSEAMKTVMVGKV